MEMIERFLSRPGNCRRSASVRSALTRCINWSGLKRIIRRLLKQFFSLLAVYPSLINHRPDRRVYDRYHYGRHQPATDIHQRDFSPKSCKGPASPVPAYRGSGRPDRHATDRRGQHGPSGGCAGDPLPDTILSSCYSQCAGAQQGEPVPPPEQSLGDSDGAQQSGQVDTSPLSRQLSGLDLRTGQSVGAL